MRGFRRWGFHPIYSNPSPSLPQTLGNWTGKGGGASSFSLFAQPTAIEVGDGLLAPLFSSVGHLVAGGLCEPYLSTGLPGAQNEKWKTGASNSNRALSICENPVQIGQKLRELGSMRDLQTTNTQKRCYRIIRWGLYGLIRDSPPLSSTPFHPSPRHAVMSEWLRRLTRNQLGSARAGSNPARCEQFCTATVHKISWSLQNYAERTHHHRKIEAIVELGKWAVRGLHQAAMSEWLRS